MATASTIENQFENIDSSSLHSLSRGDRTDIANDTLQILKSGFYKSTDGSKISIAADLDRAMTGTVLYYEDDLQNDKQLIVQTQQTDSVEMKSEFQILKCTTLQAAHFLSVELGETRVGILNFASAKNPGGGFLRGSNAQEESIARSSSLYFCLNQAHIFRDFYNYHRRGERGIYSNRMIYSPHVTIFKDDNGELLPSPYHVGVVTSPAPNASVCSDAQMIRKALIERIQRILQVFKIHQHDNIVLGSFGCGVFKNDRVEVASIFREFLIEGEFRNIFKRVIFAVLVEDSYEIFHNIIIDSKQTSTMAAINLEKNDRTTSSNDGRRKKKNQRKNNRS